MITPETLTTILQVLEDWWPWLRWVVCTVLGFLPKRRRSDKAAKRIKGNTPPSRKSTRLLANLAARFILGSVLEVITRLWL